MSYYAESDFDPYAEPAVDLDALDQERAEADLDADADRFEYLSAFAGAEVELPVSAPFPVRQRATLVELPGGSFVLASCVALPEVA